MGAVEGVRFVPLTFGGGGAAEAVSRLLLSGAVLRGRIVADGALLSLAVAGQRMPLPKSVALPPGTAVEVQLSHESGMQQLRLRVLDAASPKTHAASQPQTSAPQAAPVPARMIALPPALAELLKPEQAAVLLPKLAGLPAKAVEALLTVFVTRSDAGRALARLASMLDAEVSGRRLQSGMGEAVETLARTMDAESPEEFRRAVELAREFIGSRGDRGAAAGAGREPQTLARGAADEIATLRESLAARGGAEGRAAGETIKTLDAFVERMVHSTLQNVRALDSPYQFFSIPFAPRTGIEHAQVHVIGRDGRGPGGGGEREAHLVALDLHLTNLGALWITIQSSGPACRCVIRAENGVVRAAIDAGSPSLEAALRRAGFPAAQVHTEAWDGDRVEAAALLLSRPSSFEAEA